MKYLTVGVLLLASALAIAAQTPSPKGGDKILREPLTLTGCVAAGTKANTFVLINVQRSDAAATSSTETAVYWLDSPDKLKPHVGHHVEIAGTLDDDVDKTNVKAKDGKVELKTERNSKKVEVLEGTPAADAAKAVGTSGKVISYKVKVKSVKMLSGSCS